MKNLQQIKNSLPSHVTLVVAVKYATKEQIKEVLAAGVKDLGFNTYQQLQEINPEVRVHFIGHLQSNKVKKLLELKPFLIQSVDSYKLAQKIDLVCEELGIKQKVLLQVKTDPNKEYGFQFSELEKVFDFKNIQIEGLMTIPPVNSSRNSFKLMKKYFDKLSLKYLSMGMSNDYQIAIEEGSNMVRVGSAVFND